MHFCTFYMNGQYQLGAAQDENCLFISNLSANWPSDNPPQTILDLIHLGEEGLEIANNLRNTSKEWINVEDVKWVSPMPRLQKNIFCVGRNYREHIIEGNIAQGRDPNLFPTHIELFSKATTTVIGHKDTIPSHKDITKMLDYEAELAIVIGKRGSNISAEEADEFIFGYTILNDVTGRDIQRLHGQWFKGKSLDGSCPIGPWVVNKSAISNPNGLGIRLWVNDELRQNGNTSTMIFSVQKIISELSAGLTLEPGDIIATGTPCGVGYAMKPPQPLKKGDLIIIEIDLIGRLENIVGD